MFRTTVTAAATALAMLLGTAAIAVLSASLAAAIPSDSPTPIGPAVYPGDPIAGWFVERNVIVRRSPSPQAVVAAKGQPWHVLDDVHTADAASQTSRMRYYVTLHHREARRDYQGWGVSKEILTSPFISAMRPRPVIRAQRR